MEVCVVWLQQCPVHCIATFGCGLGNDGKLASSLFARPGGDTLGQEVISASCLIGHDNAYCPYPLAHDKAHGKPPVLVKPRPIWYAAEELSYELFTLDAPLKMTDEV